MLGISIDHVPCLRAWADSLGGISYPLLSDFWPHGAVAERYGVLKMNEGVTERAIFVIDKTGVIRYIDIHPTDDQPDNEEIRKVLRSLEGTQPEEQPGASEGVYIEEPDEKAIPAGDVVVYCARWCKDCKKVWTWLEERGIEFVPVDIDYNLEARRQVRQWANGFLVTPVIKIGEQVILDFDIPKLEEAVRKLKGK